MTPDVLPTWSLVIPVKLLAQAKSRLTGLPAADREKLALAMAADTIAAAAAADPVAALVVVTDDPAVRAAAAGHRALVLPDAPAAGLNEALAFGARAALTRWPDRGVAALAADLPALRPGELVIALTAVADGRAFVPDADGTGTTLYAAAPGAAFEPLFGPDSRARHLAAGLAELDLPGLPGLRRDVDTVGELRAAAELGVGPRTQALLATLGLP